jgi:anti-anti-sigma factor
MTIEEAINGELVIPAVADSGEEAEEPTPHLAVHLLEPGGPGRSGAATVVRLTGDLDMNSARFLKERLRIGIQDLERVHLALELSRLEFIDSHGLTVLFEAKRWATERGGMLALAGLTGQPRRVFGSILEDGFFVDTPTLEEAKGVIDAARTGGAAITGDMGAAVRPDSHSA